MLKVGNVVMQYIFPENTLETTVCNSHLFAYLVIVLNLLRHDFNNGNTVIFFVEAL